MVQAWGLRELAVLVFLVLGLIDWIRVFLQIMSMIDEWCTNTEGYCKLFLEIDENLWIRF